MVLYELAILGTPTEHERSALLTTLKSMIGEFGLTIGSDVVIHSATTMASRQHRAPFVAVYFGGDPSVDIDSVKAALNESAPVIPTLGFGEFFSTAIPECLQTINGHTHRADDAELKELASAMLECVGLLRKQRRVFVSYRRSESRTAAVQLHDLLIGRGFDVFLDTHDIRPGDPFQDVLWHRLVDSDVMVMLDTPTYFESRWTRQEIGRARAKDIQVLRVIWPDHTPNKLTDLSETFYLEPIHMGGSDGPISPSVADDIALRVERLRSRSIAARYMSITGKLRADVEKIGAVVEGIGAHRSISVRLVTDKRVWLYPIVGVPTAEILNEIADNASRRNQFDAPILVYDHVGIRDSWSTHLKWLDEQISAVRSIKVSEAGWALAGWES